MTRLLTTPQIETFAPRRFVGLLGHYTMQTRGEIPAQWGAYDAMEARGPGDYFGLSCNFDPATGRFDYLCGQETEASTAPEGLSLVEIEGSFARFATKGHISTMHAALDEVFCQWMQGGALQWRQGPTVEYYPPDFDGKTGAGGYELWVPVAP